ncbi:MAG: HAD family phosphatase [Bacteroidota bacterium]
MYSTLVFDLGNVLVPFDYAPIIAKLNKIQNGLGDRFVQLYKDNYEIHRNYERGNLHTEEFLTVALEWVNYKLFGREFCKLFSSVFKIDDRVVGLLPILKKNYQLVLLSNTNLIHKKYGWGGYDFLKYFDKQILSFEVGAVKPEKKIFRAVEEFTQQPPSKHFYIDDAEEYVSAAKELGWGGIQFTSYEKLYEDLKEKKII